jgi:repressor LexA
MADRSTKKQRELLSFIDGFIKGNGYGPSYREVMRALDYKSVSTVAVHVDGLIKAGYLRKRDHSARSLEVVDLLAHTASVTEPASHEEWLVQKAAALVADYEQAGDEQLRNDAVKLIDALDVLQYSGDADSLRQRIDDYAKKH